MNKGSSNPYSSPMTQSAPPGHSGTGQLATLGERFLGALIDALVTCALVVPLALVAGFAIGATGLMQESALLGLIVSSVAGGVIGIGIFLALHGYLLAKNGQTIGKLVMKTKIVSEATGQQLSFAEVLLKRYVPIWVISMIPYLGALAGLVNVLMIFRENRHCLHDDIAGTKVISIK
jgi:uncharacterized RDD family membrane protein YckC